MIIVAMPVIRSLHTVTAQSDKARPAVSVAEIHCLHVCCPVHSDGVAAMRPNGPSANQER